MGHPCAVRDPVCECTRACVHARCLLIGDLQYLRQSNTGHMLLLALPPSHRRVVVWEPSCDGLACLQLPEDLPTGPQGAVGFRYLPDACTWEEDGCAALQVALRLVCRCAAAVLPLCCRCALPLCCRCAAAVLPLCCRCVCRCAAAVCPLCTCAAPCAFLCCALTCSCACAHTRFIFASCTLGPGWNGSGDCHSVSVGGRRTCRGLLQAAAEPCACCRRGRGKRSSRFECAPSP